MKKIEVLPSLLAADFSDLKGQIRKIEAAGCSKLHLDIMDGNFVPNITFGPALIRSIRRISGLFFQAHLMIDRPERYLETFKRAGVDGIIIHEESCCNFRNTLKAIKALKLKAGIALKPTTPVYNIEDIVNPTSPNLLTKSLLARVWHYLWSLLILRRYTFSQAVCRKAPSSGKSFFAPVPVCCKDSSDSGLSFPAPAL